MVYADLVNPLGCRQVQSLPHDLPTKPNESSDIPMGFPAVINHALAWSGSQLQDESEYIYHLGNSDVGELEAGLNVFKTYGLDGNQIDCENFPLPTLEAKLRSISHAVYNGRGLYVIRGIDPSDYSVEDLTMLWLGIQSYVANQRGCQDHKGNMLVHIVADDTSDNKKNHSRHSKSSISFHTEEAGDIAAWLTRNTPVTGGECIVASAYHVYNVLAECRPDVVDTLAKADWPLAYPRYQCRPLIFFEENHLIINFGPISLLGNNTHPRPESIPPINQSQHEALGIVEAIAQAAELKLQTRPGDMHFINNLALLHRRNSFVDGSLKQEKRHLIRMRLRSSELGWSIPAQLKPDWVAAFESDTWQTWHMEHVKDHAFPLRRIKTGYEKLIAETVQSPSALHGMDTWWTGIGDPS
ncbi:putative TauD/TfdA-like domain-containing protein [Seiridium unicorne]|uniref:TauD/TfdA-like domain-containing protein n=1 Tax=Seiridium unicorne TaxID=138068 RepID=A0ABR2UI80_9PEZI